VSGNLAVRDAAPTGQPAQMRDERASPCAPCRAASATACCWPRRRPRPPTCWCSNEPTNDLDADTLDLLQEALSDYDGTVLLVSHDRDFLDRLVTSTIALEGDGTAIEYAGNYSDYLAQRAPREKPAAVPTRKDKVVAPAREQGPAKRLSYKRERALAEAPKKIEALHAEMAALNAALDDPDRYGRDSKTFAAKTARLGAAQSALDAAETEWLELELLREELNGRL